jgi:hypothetical protein
MMLFMMDLNPVINSTNLTRAIPEFFNTVFPVDVSTKWVQKSLSLSLFKSYRLSTLLISLVSSQFSLELFTFFLETLHFLFFFFFWSQRRNLGVVGN